MPQKLLLITSWFPIAEKPQSGIFFQQQAILLSKQYDVKVLVCNSNRVGRKGFIKSFFKKPNPEFEYIKSTQFEVIDFNILEFVFLNEKNRFKNMFNNFNKQLKQLFKTWKPDIIHAHDAWFAGVIANKISSETGVPYILTNHTPLFINTSSSLVNTLLLNAIANANQLTTVGNQDKRIFESILALKNKAITIGNIIDTDLFNPLNKEKNSTDSFKIVHITSTSIRKDIPTFLKAIHHYIKDYSTTKKLEVLLIASQINDGYSIDLLKKDIEVLDLKNIVTVKSNMPNTAVAKELAASQLYISTSYYETFGVSVAEAIAMGIPTIVVDNGAARDFVNDFENGLIAETGDYKKIAFYIDKIATNEIVFDESKMHESIASKYSKEAFLNKLNKVYESVLKHS